MNKKETKEATLSATETIRPRLIEVKDKTYEDIRKLYVRISAGETKVSRLEYKIRDLKMAIIVLCIAVVGYGVLDIVKTVWSK